MKRQVLIIYILIWVAFSILFFVKEIPLSMLFIEDALIVIHFIFVIIALPTYLIRYLSIAKKNKTLKVAFRKIIFRGLIPISLFLIILKAILIYNQTEDYNYSWDYTIENTKKIASNRFDIDGKLRGMSVYALGRDRYLKLADVAKSNVEWLAVHPYMSQLSETSSDMSLPEMVGLWSKKDSAFLKDIKAAKAKNFRIMLKPHLWVNNGWRANINFDSRTEWDIWYTNYKSNMLHYAQMAEQANVEMFCIGTELQSSLENKSRDWVEFIKEIRQIYSGKLTYASNWDSNSFYDEPEFWKSIDYIGIQAYFPLSKHKSPNLEEIKSGWDMYIKDLEQLHKTYNKPIIFTELGYRADRKATVEPWEWDSLFSPLLKKKSEKTQLLAFEAFFQKLWHQDWFSGVFIWQWNSSFDFSVHRKPAQNNIAKWYSKLIINNRQFIKTIGRYSTYILKSNRGSKSPSKIPKKD